MDIWAYARRIDFEADYYDPHTGYIYHLQEYGKARKLGLPAPYDGIRVSENGVTIGVVHEEE